MSKKNHKYCVSDAVSFLEKHGFKVGTKSISGQKASVGVGTIGTSARIDYLVNYEGYIYISGN